MDDTDNPQNTPSPQRRVSAESSPGSGLVETCTGCHQPLVRRGPKGECLRCLMDFVFPSEEEMMPPRTTSGTQASVGYIWRYGHFDIAVGPDGQPVELGAGAMATTYRATDSVLHSDVALKVINRKVAEHPAARARFLREARAAAKLHHPNVARVSHYGEQNGECYYAMELVEGETLEARLRREGPLVPALVLEIGVQVARALAAAEACGVVHRDLKPSNIMLTTPQGERTDGSASTVVKVIDWGLAKAVSSESVLGSDHTQGGFLGTPAFASPEQFSSAEDRRIDTRSDIYSLGVTLWYLLCGRAPFAGTTLEEIHSHQVRRALPLEQLSAARVPGRVVTLLKCMLSIDRAARPQSARELIDALRGCQKQFPLEAATGQVRRRWSRPIVATLVLLALVAIALAGWMLLYRAPIAPTDRSVAVLPFENLSPEAADAFFTTGVQDQFTADLARVASLKVIGPDSTRLYPPKDRHLARIGQELGVAYLLEGSVRRTDARVAITVRLVNARSSTRVWENQYDRPLSDVFALQREIVHAVTDRLQVTLTPGESAAVNELPTGDLVAYDLYLRAHAGTTLTVDEASDRQEQRRRIALLEKAVARDPGFFLAYCDLARAHDTLQLRQAGSTAEESAVDHRAIAESMLATAQRLRPDAGELHLARAYHFRFTNATLAQARIEVDLARQSLPNNAEVEVIAGAIARSQGLLEDAIRYQGRAVALEPRDRGAYYELAQTYRVARHYEDFERTMTRLIAITPERENGSLPLLLAMGAYEGRGDTAPLRAALAALPVTDDPESQRRDFFSIVLSLADHDADALSRLLAARKQSQIMAYGVPLPKGWYEGLAARIRGDGAGARAAFASARPEIEKLFAAHPSSSRVLSLLATIDAGLGRPEAVDEARRACELAIIPATKTRVGCNLAVVYAWVGQSDLAFAELEKWVGGPPGDDIPNQPTYGDFRLNPIWDPLRSDPRFEVLVQRLAPKRASGDVSPRP